MLAGPGGECIAGPRTGRLVPRRTHRESRAHVIQLRIARPPLASSTPTRFSAMRSPVFETDLRPPSRRASPDAARIDRCSSPSWRCLSTTLTRSGQSGRTSGGRSCPRTPATPPIPAVGAVPGSLWRSASSRAKSRGRALGGARGTVCPCLCARARGVHWRAARGRTQCLPALWAVPARPEIQVYEHRGYSLGCDPSRALASSRVHIDEEPHAMVGSSSG